VDQKCTWLSTAGVYVSHEQDAWASASMRITMRTRHTSYERPVVVRNAARALRLARSGPGPVLAFLPDWDAVDTLRAIAARSGLETRLAVHHRSAAALTKRNIRDLSAGPL
jgi:hypothetical protein